MNTEPTIDAVVTALLADGELDVASAVSQFTELSDLGADVWTGEERAAIDRAIRAAAAAADSDRAAG